MAKRKSYKNKTKCKRRKVNLCRRKTVKMRGG